YANLAMMRDAATAAGPWRRHVPPALFLLAITGMVAALARPAAVLTLPSQHQTIILAMDTSGSMRATDVKPNRLAAAQAAAKTFIADQPSTTRIGIVAFAATAALVQPPTDRRDDVLAAIDRFQMQRGTAVGSGILVSLKAIIPDVQFDLKSANPRGDKAKERKGISLDAAREPAKDAPADAQKAPPGSYPSAAIILLTDGQTTTGPDPVESARMAAERGVRVFTVGVGTPTGETLHAEGWTTRARLDEDALKNIANVTRGEYFFAGSAPDLKKIYQTLNTKLFFERRETEITAFFAAGAALLALTAALLSMLWFNRLL
ncbi:MAG: VWA domain-containing protein, partial [Pseudomonadota bacterium]|nr:VWA domain-containing protein [Pseudomonadota bacterium]